MNEKVHTHVQHHFSYEETVLIALHHQSSGSLCNQLSQVHGGDWTKYARMTNYFSNFIHHKFAAISAADRWSNGCPMCTLAERPFGRTSALMVMEIKT